ncbi:hypothetical protein V1514DRAFT_328943 [Lipomyces japonicus]|uniref:uncharacterized protein n=1 Tax=Lipomyces japonicus TaxID=56871 RepID=UPI0034CE7131
MAIKKKSGGESRRRHRFISFRDRVDSIKIDPLRRTNRHNEIGDRPTESFFHVALLTWKELNSTKSFTTFASEVATVSESLPQVLYHKEKIFTALNVALNEKDIFALQALLDLMAQFAHDLGPDFEQFLNPAIVTLISVSLHEEIEVVEWTFNCLAYLFKYLFRFLVAKLPETFDLIVPLLSQHERRPHLSRFAAESFSFFLRNSKLANIDILISHVFQRLQESNSKILENSLIIIFADALKGPDGTMHSKASRLIYRLQEYCTESSNERDYHVFLSILTNTLHYINKSTSESLYDPVFKWIKRQLVSKEEPEAKLYMAAKEFFVLLGLRKGTRVHDWTIPTKLFFDFVAAVEQLPNSQQKSTCVWELNKVAFCIIQYFPDSDVGLITKVVQAIYTLDKSFYISFVDMTTDLQNLGTNFEIIRMFFQRYLESLEELDSFNTLAILRILQRTGERLDDPKYKSPIKGTSKLQFSLLKSIDQVMIEFNNSEVDLSALQGLRPRLELTYAIFDRSDKIGDYAFKVSKAIGKSSCPTAYEIGSIYGRALLLFAKSYQKSTNGLELLTDAVTRFTDFRENIFFLGGLSGLLISLKGISNEKDKETLSSTATAILPKLDVSIQSTNAGVRLQALELASLCLDVTGKAVPDILSLCLSIERTPFELSTARTFSTNIRRIAITFQAISEKSLKILIINYVFALLKSHFQPVWQEASKTLAALSSQNRDYVWSLLFEGIQTQNVTFAKPDDQEMTEVEPTNAYSFDCYNLNFIDQASLKALQAQDNVVSDLKNIYKGPEKIPIDHNAVRRRSYGVLVNVHSIAEQHANLIVPLFFLAFEKSGQKQVLLDILKLFAAFNDPAKSLGKHDVYPKLLNLLSSPDTDIQRAALDSIFAWKDSGVNLYRDNLINLLSIQTFRDEINRLILSNEDGTIIAPQHASAVMPLIVHILYGSSIGFHANNTGKSKSSHRSTILSAVGNLPAEYVLEFVKLASDGVPVGIVLDESLSSSSIDWHISISSSQFKRIVGFMTMAEDLLRVVKSKIGNSGDLLLRLVLSCVIYSQKSLSAGALDSDLASSARSVRSLGMKCLDIIFENIPSINWDEYMSLLFKEIISPRMQNFLDENTQDISPIMKIFLIWSTSPDLALHLTFDEKVLPKIIACLDSNAAKEAIYLAVIEFVHNLLELQENNKSAKIRSINEYVIQLFLSRLVLVLSANKSTAIVERGIAVLRKIVTLFNTSIIENEVLLEQYISVCLSGIGSWGNAAQHINDIFDVLASLLISVKNTILLEKCYDELAPLLQSVRERHTRASLVKIFTVLGQHDDYVKIVAELLVEMNAYSKRRLDELDFERRFGALKKLTGEYSYTINPRQWTPLLYHSIFYIATGDELPLQQACGSILKLFVEKTSEKAKDEALDRAAFFSVLESVIIPAIRAGLRNENEISRHEYVSILRTLVVNPQAYPKAGELQCLLFDGDEEADFFNNIIHIQAHRRQRAIYRLGQIALTRSLGDYNISHFLLPLLEHFLKDVTEVTSGMAEEAISTIGKLSLSLSWNQYQAIVRRYILNLEKNREKTRFFSRLLDSVAEAIYQRYRIKSAEVQLKSYNSKKVDDFVATEVAPKMRAIIRISEESSLADRVGVTVPLIKFLCATSEETLTQNLSNVVLEISQHLKNRLQDIRDSVRKVLSRVSLLIGQKHLSLILRQLQSVLKRGAHKHILSFSAHSLLQGIVSSPTSKHGDLDPTIDQVMDICMDDIFGDTGSEKDAEGYRSKLREVKENKSYDSIEILSSNVDSSRFEDMLNPVRRILSSETVNIKIERKIAEVLRRMSLGIASNTEGNTTESIKFALKVCSTEYENTEPSAPKYTRDKAKRFMVGKKIMLRNHMPENIHFLQRFALDIIKNGLQKNRELTTGFELQEFVTSLKPYLGSSFEDIQLSSFKLVTIAARYSSLLNKLDTEYLFNYVVGIVQNASTVTSEICQTGLRLLAALVQKRRYSEKDVVSISYIIQKLNLDFIEPDKQSHSYAFIKAVLAQKIMASEIYDVMDKIREIMINAQTKNTREVAKSLYCSFMLEYPQGRGRLGKQMRFLVQNLEYDHVAGRESVLEALYVLLSKSKDDAVQSIIETFFVPLTMTLVNDESNECKEMVMILFSTIAKKANQENINSMYNSCLDWKKQDGVAALAEAAEKIFEVIAAEHDIEE